MHVQHACAAMKSYSGSMESISLPREIHQQVLDHARSAPDVEVCGLIAAKHGVPVRCVPVGNIAAQPQQHFTMDPQQQIDAFRMLREQGEQLFAIYHSHPQGPACPSDTDLQQAGYPDAVQIIVALQASTPLRCFRFIEGTVQELRLAVP